MGEYRLKSHLQLSLPKSNFASVAEESPKQTKASGSL
jgi:hypothetical protein